MRSDMLSYSNLKAPDIHASVVMDDVGGWLIELVQASAWSSYAL